MYELFLDPVYLKQKKGNKKTVVVVAVVADEVVTEAVLELPIVVAIALVSAVRTLGVASVCTEVSYYGR